MIVQKTTPTTNNPGKNSALTRTNKEEQHVVVWIDLFSHFRLPINIMCFNVTTQKELKPAQNSNK